uniref:Fe(III) reductase beta subunit n=1 Tax=Vibrio harveyi TaxID=669 RepID=E5G5Q7_VIBHA|nr:Fe(III) reductase beta subunit [Vibrio harveyi]
MSKTSLLVSGVSLCSRLWGVWRCSGENALAIQAPSVLLCLCRLSIPSALAFVLWETNWTRLPLWFPTLSSCCAMLCDEPCTFTTWNCLVEW